MSGIFVNKKEKKIHSLCIYNSHWLEGEENENFCSSSPSILPSSLNSLLEGCKIIEILARSSIKVEKKNREKTREGLEAKGARERKCINLEEKKNY
jgi:hypothetical protein